LLSTPPPPLFSLIIWVRAENPSIVNLVDPFFSAAALHFDDLFQRYGAPCIVLNLVKVGSVRLETRLS
jgi:hypothetical protein